MGLCCVGERLHISGIVTAHFGIVTAVAGSMAGGLREVGPISTLALAFALATATQLTPELAGQAG